MTSNEIQIAFQNAFGRKATAAELSYWGPKASTALRDALRKDTKTGGVYADHRTQQQGINAAFSNAFGRNATQGELNHWSSKSSEELQTALRADTKAGGVYKTWRDAQAPAPIISAPPPEDLATKFLNAYNTNLPGYQKDSYEAMVKNYGIRNSTIEKQIFGDTVPDWLNSFDISNTQFGLAQAASQNQIALGPQEFQNALDRYNTDKTQAEAGWNNLKARIGSGELDVNGQEYRDTVQQLQQMTQAVQATKQSLSASGNYFGGAYQKQLGNAQIDQQTGKVISGQVGQALQPYVSNIQDIHSQYGYQRGNAQADYDAAMQTYLGNKKAAQEKAGMEQGTGGANALGFEYGGGTWNPTTGTYENMQYGLTPEQASKAGLGFVGSDVYNQITAQAQKKKDLESLGQSYYDTLLNNSITGLRNQMGY